MLRSAKRLKSCSLHATDGRIGQVEDIYFDGETWEVRYLVIDTGTWLKGRRVLISPAVIDHVDWQRQSVHVVLNQMRVQNSPPIDAAKPVSRRHDKAQSGQHWPLYGIRSGNWVNRFSAERAPEETERDQKPDLQEAEPGLQEAEDELQFRNLRSAKEVIGYRVQASDGEIGHIEDFLIDEEAWTIQYAAVDTRNWLPGKKVLVTRQWLGEISWPEKRVFVDRTRESIKSGPEWDASSPLSMEYRIIPE